MADHIPVRRCGACGFRFAAADDVRAARGTDAEFYAPDYFDGRDDSGYAAYLATAPTLRRNAARQLAAVLRSGAGCECLLELGSGGGHFLHAAARHFGRVYGIEICEGICERPLPPNATLFERPVEQVSAAEIDGPVTAIALWDVVEHLADPCATVRWLGRVAAPGCRLLLTTGDVSSPLARLMGRRWRLMTPREHYGYFDPATIARALAAGGFEVTRVRHPWKWVPACLALAQLGRMTGLLMNAWRLVPETWRVPMTLGDVMLVEATRR
ncbi:MAG: class I SAM-dependent methyltransferase [Gemmatimonadota bacterium]|nr:class I SAM-dependent methyltransferase [Gemmatimonadota bacterium]